MLFHSSLHFKPSLFNKSLSRFIFTNQKTGISSIYFKSLVGKQSYNNDLTKKCFSTNYNTFPLTFNQSYKNNQLSISTRLVFKRNIRDQPRFRGFDQKPENNIYKSTSGGSSYFSSLPTILGLGASALFMYNFPGVFMIALIGGFGYGSFKIFQIFNSFKKLINDSKNDLHDFGRDPALGHSSKNASNLKRDDFPLQVGLGGLMNSFILPIFKNILSASQNFSKASENLQTESISILQDHISNKTDTGLLLISEFGPEIDGLLRFKHIHVSSASSINNQSNKILIIFSAHMQGNPLFDVQAQGSIIDTKSDGDLKVEVESLQLSIFHSNKHLDIPTQVKDTNKGFGRVKEAEYREL